MTDQQRSERIDYMALWRKHGGGQHGPRIETVTMPLSKFSGFLNDFAALTARPEPQAATGQVTGEMVEAAAVPILAMMADGSNEWAANFYQKFKAARHEGDCGIAAQNGVQAPATCSRCCCDQATQVARQTLTVAFAHAPAVPEDLRRLSEHATLGQWAIWDVISECGQDEYPPPSRGDIRLIDTESKICMGVLFGGHKYSGEMVRLMQNGPFIVAVVNWVRSLLADAPKNREG